METIFDLDGRRFDSRPSGRGETAQRIVRGGSVVSLTWVDVSAAVLCPEDGDRGNAFSKRL